MDLSSPSEEEEEVRIEGKREKPKFISANFVLESLLYIPFYVIVP